ncbi:MULTISPECIES: hypothetical protein [Parabacteroides]|uniref:hypothetical protein n=1 Tax=Parabacteroides provencensis TaxID=1944636 RepID=UPI001304711F|nr:hypothetical protein [Parabacteroides provencensis]
MEYNSFREKIEFLSKGILNPSERNVFNIKLKQEVREDINSLSQEPETPDKPAIQKLRLYKVYKNVVAADEPFHRSHVAKRVYGTAVFRLRNCDDEKNYSNQF